MLVVSPSHDAYVVPALSESEFGVPKIRSCAHRFCGGVRLVKARSILSPDACRNASVARRCCAGLGCALPIPAGYFAPSWSWIVAATVLLGINQADLVDDADLQAGHHPLRSARLT